MVPGKRYHTCVKLETCRRPPYYGGVNWNISHIGLWQLCAPLRDSNHLTNQPQAAPLSPAVPRSPLFMISRIFSAQLSN